jgi:hypothetical protein
MTVQQSSSSPSHVGEHHAHPQAFWLWVMCLTGVDYFSTLGYQPSIAFDNAGMLAPLATVVLVAVTLFGALPIYNYVAQQSPNGQGSIAMLEKLVSGWGGKSIVLLLLGFAATDFVITKTLSAADAAEHIIHNSLWLTYGPGWLQGNYAQVVLTMTLLVLLGAMFLRGFNEVIYLAVVLVAVYLFLNLIIIGSGLCYLATHSELIANWWQQVKSGNWHIDPHHLHFTGTDPLTIGLVCLLIFPKLALGLSGFETGVAVMPLVQGNATDTPANPVGRVKNTRKLLLTAALIMSVYLLGSACVVSMLIHPAAFVHLEHADAAATHTVAHETNETIVAKEAHAKPSEPLPAGVVEGKAANRALAYLAHAEGQHNINPMFGEVFGTIYDISTVLILWFAGASAMSGLLNLVPQYLPRYGMAPEWASAIRPLVILFTLINLFVTWIFSASVEAQGGAYATGVLVLMSSASVATVIDIARKRSGAWYQKISWPMLFVTCVFFYTTTDIMIEKPDGMKIASFFILAIIVSSFVSRVMRSTELRLTHFVFENAESKMLWDSLLYLEIPVLVPHRPGRRDLIEKEEDIRRVHRLDSNTPIVYVEAIPGDASEFLHTPHMEVISQEERFILRVTKCHSVAHVIAAVGLELAKQGHPPEIHFGWSDEMPLAANIKFVLFGEGNVPWMVRELIRKAQPDSKFQPRIVIG